jgi:hypothetical protein
MSEVSKPYTKHDPEAWKRYQKECKRLFGKKGDKKKKKEDEEEN